MCTTVLSTATLNSCDLNTTKRTDLKNKIKRKLMIRVFVRTYCFIPLFPVLEFDLPAAVSTSVTLKVKLMTDNDNSVTNSHLFILMMLENFRI